MRILLMPSSYPPVLGGVQTVAHTLACQLTKQGHDVRVVSSRYPRSLQAHQVLDGVPVRRWLFLTPDINDLRRKRPDLFFASCYFYPSTLFRFSRLMQTFRPEVINVHFPDSQIPFVFWLRRRFGFRLVVSLHGHEVERWFDGCKTGGYCAQTLEGLTGHRRFRKFRKFLQEADVVTACSQYLLQRAVKLEPSLAKKGFVIQNGIDLERFRDKTAYRHPRPFILGYGRLTYKKGFDLLIEAFAHIAQQNPSLDLILAGDGEERESLQAQVKWLGLDRRVYFFGRATPEDVVRLLNGCLLVVVPSRQEPFGIVVLEGVAAGKPVIASTIGGIPELTEKLPQIQLIEPENSDDLRTKMLRVLEENRSHVCNAPFEDEGMALPSIYSWSQIALDYSKLMLS